jgi:lysophospholipase L1-like esterase
MRLRPLRNFAEGSWYRQDSDVENASRIPIAWRGPLIGTLAAAAFASALPARGTDAREARHEPALPGMRWVTAWGTSQQPDTTPVQVSDQTVRLIARVTLPGDVIRIRLDNTFSAAPVTIGRAYVGARASSALVAPDTSRQVTFDGGAAQVVIPAGGSVTSDPVELRVLAQQDLAVSLYVPDASVQASQHGDAVVTSYMNVVGGGDAAADEAATAFTRTFTSMPWLKAIDVLSPRQTSTIVAFGDSITDGTCTTLDAHDRWEDLLSVRLDTDPLGDCDVPKRLRERWPRRRGMVNEGIGGNTLTGEGLRPPPDSIPGLERLERDVLSHHGVSHVILFMGTNDIRREQTAENVIAAMRTIAQRVKAEGIAIYGATIIPRHDMPPSGTNTGWNPAKTQIRNAVNQWIRTSGVFDAVLDFDAVVRDPAAPDRIYPPFNCGDGIHPSPAGYYQMGKSLDLNLFDAGRRRRHPRRWPSLARIR